MSRSAEPVDPQSDITQKGEPGDGFFPATASGPASLRRALDLYKEACDTAVAQGYSKILLDWLAVTGEISLRERHTLGRKAAEYAHRNRMSLKVAVLGMSLKVAVLGKELQ